jgi:hypothetical protein
MSFFRKLLSHLLPEDPSNDCGYGPFKLPHDHPFTRGCNLHDFEFEQAHRGKSDKTIDQVDWELFYRWTMIARAAPTHAKRCELAGEICRYWPLARSVGALLWDGKDE